MTDASSPSPQKTGFDDSQQTAYTQLLPVDLHLRQESSSVSSLTLVGLALGGLVLFFLFLITVNVSFLFAKAMQNLPNLTNLTHWNPSESTQVYDRNHQLIAVIRGDEDRIVRPLNDISPWLPRAIMAIEDNRFYHHSGVDIKGTFRAIAQNLAGGDLQGGSTLTQQLVKNIYLSSERSLERKIAEAILSNRIEQLYSKDRILELYLNVVYWGNQAYGAEKAARRYFNKPANHLSVAEGALLAGLLKAPEGLNPFVFPEAAKTRQLEVLGAMYQHGFITRQQLQEAKQQPLHFFKEVTQFKHPYFVSHVMAELQQRFGEEVVRKGGLKVITSLDSNAQQQAELALKEGIAKAPAQSQIESGALVSINVDDASILALVGGADFNKSQFNAATMAQRAPGSTFKPFVYLTSFRLGIFTPDSIIVDRPIQYKMASGYWRPKNWDGRFLGPLPIRKALALSRNTTTIQVGQRVGVEEVIKTSRLAGFTSEIPNNFSSFLGASGVSPLELATAYSTLARGGGYVKPRAILDIETNQGQRLILHEVKPEHRFERRHAAMINSALTTVVQEGTAKAASLPNRTVAGKTGTTDRTRDIWFAGYTPDLVSVVWLGNLKNRPLVGVFSSNCVKIWHQYNTAYYQTHPVAPKAFETY
ncbi:MAG: transglycosylase domain-containing protein [Vampirovibrionales bacterium]